MLAPKKYSYKEFDSEKKFLRLENSPPSPRNFSNGPSVPKVYFIMPTAGYNLTEMLKVGNGVYFFRTFKANFSRKLKMSELLLLKIKGY